MATIGASAAVRLAITLRPSPSLADSIRDALGYVRLLYAARKTREATLTTGTDPLVSIGRELADALDLAGHEEGSLGHRAAKEKAARALAQLDAEVTMGDTASRMAKVAKARVSGEKFAVAGRSVPERR